MSVCRRVAIFLSFICFCAAIAMVGTCLTTEFWFESFPKHNELPEFESYVHGGLFAGSRQLNWGLGVRIERFKVLEELDRGVSFMYKSLWICLIVLLTLSLLWILIGVILSLINTVICPIETVSGSLGIYLWSFLAFASTTSVSILYLAQYLSTIHINVLLKEQQKGGFSTSNRTRLGFSYWLLVGSCAVLLMPILLLLLSGIKCRHRVEIDAEQPTEKGLFMY